MDERRGSITDDWQEIESAASVVSLATSDASDDPLLWSRPASPVFPPHDPLPPAPTAGASATAARSAIIINHDAPQDSSHPDDDHRDSSRRENPRSPTEFFENADNEPRQETYLESESESESESINPTECHKACCAAIESLNTVANLAHEIGSTRVSTLSMLRITCLEISMQAQELEKMLKTYSDYWTAQGQNISPDDMPLSPNVFHWISHLRVQVLRAQGELLNLKPEGSPGPSLPLNPTSIPLRVNSALSACLESLEDSQGILAEFLPILKAQVQISVHRGPTLILTSRNRDFDEFRTKWMNFPQREVGELQSQPRREPPHPAVCRIRRELYDLKDRIRMIAVFLSDMEAGSESLPLLEATPPVVRSLENMVEAISTILTNNGTDWIAYDLASRPKKTISYPEFLTLDPDILHDITGHLQAFQQELDIGCEVSFRTYTQEMIRNHQLYLLLEGGQLQELSSTMEFLESLLMSGL
ncbi:hypothetical protein ACJ41O_011950 [Fusarium nematophilum]